MIKKTEQFLMESPKTPVDTSYYYYLYFLNENCQEFLSFKFFNNIFYSFFSISLCETLHFFFLIRQQSIPEDDFIMGESLDIIEKVDSDERFGATGQILPATGRKDIKAWQKSVQTLLRTLQRPRYVATGLLPEFQQIDGRHAFIKNHQLPPYEKPEWKGDGTDENPGMDMDEKLKLYAEAMSMDPTALIEDLNAKLVELDDLIFSEHHCSEVGLSMDDIDLWARLRSITIVKGVQWPTKLRAYMDNLSALGDVPLYDEMAL